VSELDLDGRCAVVTGGGHGIGRAMAEAFANAGARVVVADVHEDRGRKIASRVGGAFVRCDVGVQEEVASLVDAAVDAFGPVHVFASNAGVVAPAASLGAMTADIDLITRVNLLAHVWAAQAVVPSMVERGGGHIVQTISSASLITGPSGMGYTFTKHGALGFAEWLSLNYRHLGVVVTCLCPNAVNTGFLGRDEDAEESAGGATTRERRGLLDSLGEVVEPELCASMTLDAMAANRFLVLPHPRVGESFLRKAQDYDAWLERTNVRLRRMQGESL